MTEHGDCGSWVVDFHNGKLYGYITAGDPQTSIAYIIPAYQAVYDIEQRLNEKVTLPGYETNCSLPSTSSSGKAGVEESHLPKGDCRYILPHAGTKVSRCACAGFMLNQSSPGTMCDCGHQACYHVREPNTTTSIQAMELDALRERITLLEKQVGRERPSNKGGLIDRLNRLEELVENGKEEADTEIKNLYQGMGSLRHQTTELPLLDSSGTLTQIAVERSSYIREVF